MLLKRAIGSWRRKSSPHSDFPLIPLAHQAIGDLEMPFDFKQTTKFEELNNCQINVFQWVLLCFFLKRKSMLIRHLSGIVGSFSTCSFESSELISPSPTNLFYGFDEKTLVPLRISKLQNNLLLKFLLLEDELNCHNVLITDLKSLVNKVTVRPYRSRDVFYRDCFYICSSEETLFSPQKFNEPAAIRMPTPNMSKVCFSRTTQLDLCPYRVLFWSRITYLASWGICTYAAEDRNDWIA